MRFGHEERAEADFGVIQAFSGGVFQHLDGHPAAGIQVHQGAAHPVETRQDIEDIRDHLAHPDGFLQSGQVMAGQVQGMPAVDVEDSLQADAALQVAVKVYAGVGGVEGHGRLIV